MKILFVASSASYGGAFLFCCQLARGLKNAGQNILLDLVLIHNSGITFSGLHNTFDDVTISPSVTQFSALVESNNYDLIHWWKSNNDTNFSAFAQIASRKTPILLSLCQVPTKATYAISFSNYLYSSIIIYPCQSAADHWRSTIYPKASSKIIYLGSYASELGEQSLDQIKPSSRADVSIIRGSALGKCPNLAIDLFSRVSKKVYNFKIAGSGSTYEMRRLTKHVQRLNLDNRVSFLGQLSYQEWLNALRTSDIYTYVLDKNCFAAIDGTLQDAMLCRLPVVYMGPKGPAELIEHQVSGFIARDNSEFIKYVDILAHSPELRKIIGTNARKRILENFSFNLTVKHYLKAYKQAIKTARPVLGPKEVLQLSIAIFLRTLDFTVLAVASAATYLKKKLYSI